MFFFSEVLQCVKQEFFFFNEFILFYWKMKKKMINIFGGLPIGGTK